MVTNSTKDNKLSNSNSETNVGNYLVHSIILKKEPHGAPEKEVTCSKSHGYLAVQSD